MEREYVRVRPSREQLNPDDIVSHISSLHKLTRHGEHQTVRSRLNPLKDSSETVPEFEFLAISQGKDSPVEFFYGTKSEHLNALKNRLTTAYPASFDVEIIEVNVLEKIIPPERYAPEDFVKKIQDGHLLFDPDAVGSPDDIEGNNRQKNSETDTEDGDGKPDAESAATSTADNGKEIRANGGQENVESPAEGDMISVDVARPSETTQPNTPEDAITPDGDETVIGPDDVEEYEMLEEMDAGLLELVELPEELDANFLDADIDGPTWTEEGDILARPTLEHGEPVAARWNGDGERKKDWMTTMKMFSKVARPDSDDIEDRAPLANLIQHLANSDLPIAFQVVFKRVEDWSRQAERRKDNLHLNRDTLGQKVMYELGEIIHSPSKERRRERRKDYMDSIGESADSNAESPITGDVGKRRKLIDNKIPKRTFRANIRAVSVANDEVPVADVRRTMDELASVLDHLDGYFYGLEPNILEDGTGYRNKKQATEEFHRLINREITTGSGKQRPDIVVNADELANFITVPSSTNLTVQGVRGTRAEAEARDPLAKPDPDLMREFHAPGMRIGYALDKEAEREPVPTQVPPGLLTTHYGRFATTGAGKSKALINDILSLHENTDGPAILVDPKGDGMTQNYMKAHFERFGEEDFKENVIHYPIPDILPGFTFFNIEPALEQGMRRGDAIQNKADHYQELLKLVMGRESYEESKVAPILISAFIKALFDEKYVKYKTDEGHRGESDSVLCDRKKNEDEEENTYEYETEKFTHRQLEELAKEVREHGTGNDDGELPELTEKNKPVENTIEEQTKGDDRSFSVIMNSVFNRLNYIREDEHLRKIFNNTEKKFDFRDHLNDNKVILFDMGELRDDATMVMTGLILTNLWDSLKESDRSVCTQNHTSIEACRDKARKNGLDPEDPQCREPWPDDHLVNLIIDEAASVAVSGIMDKMLEQGRSFHLSVGLSMQFPEQMKGASGDRTYKNVLNNIGTKLIGKITLDEEIAKAMAHEGMDVTDFGNRISSLPRGEWIAQLPSPNFMQTGPEPFSLQPLPIPAGHPESKHILTEEAEQRFDHFLDNQVHRRTQEEFGIDKDEEEAENGSSNEDPAVDQTNLDDETGGTSEKSTGGEDSPDGDGEHDDTPLGDVNYGELGEEDDGETTQTDDAAPSDGFNALAGDSSGPGDTPPHVKWDDNVYTCLICGTEYFKGEKTEAFRCCAEDIKELQESIGDPTEIELLTRDSNGYAKSDEKYIGPDNELHTYHTVVQDDELSFANGVEPSLKDQPITRAKEITKIHNELDSVSIGAVASAIVAAMPPEYQQELETAIDWYLNALQNNADKIEEDVELTEEWLQELIYNTPPADIDIDVDSLLDWLSNSVNEETLQLWESNSCAPAFKRFYSGRVTVPDTNLARPGKYGLTYDTTAGLAEPINPAHLSPAAFGLPSEDDSPPETNNTSENGGESPDEIEVVGAPDINESHLDEYGITRSEAKFMKAVVKAMNRELDGYTLLDSMNEIKSMYGPDIDKLIEKGYLKQHAGADRRSYFTVTPDGQKACKLTQEHGPNIGDRGDDTPHRVGIELAKQYYESMPTVRRVEISPDDDGNGILDLVAVDENGNNIAVIEVEGGQVSADAGSDDSDQSIHNYKEVRKDYNGLAEADGESIWVVRNHEVAGSVLRALHSGDNDEVPFEMPVREADRFSDPVEKIKAVESSDLKMDDLNDSELSEYGDAGVDKLLTYKQLRNNIKEQEESE